MMSQNFGQIAHRILKFAPFFSDMDSGSIVMADGLSSAGTDVSEDI
jgi:hypothetical protein